MKSVPWVMIMPSMESFCRWGRQVSANFFQSLCDMFSDHFMKGDSIFVMLQMVFNSGAMFSISSLSVEIVPPDFGSSLEEIVPPVIIMAMFLRSLFFEIAFF